MSGSRSGEGPLLGSASPRSLYVYPYWVLKLKHLLILEIRDSTYRRIVLFLQRSRAGLRIKELKKCLHK